MKTNCIVENALDEYVLGRLNDTERATIEEHTIACQACLEALATTDVLVEALQVNDSATGG